MGGALQKLAAKEKKENERRLQPSASDVIIALPRNRPDNAGVNYRSRLERAPSEELQGITRVFMNWQRDAFVVTARLVKLHTPLSSKRLMYSRIKLP